MKDLKALLVQELEIIMFERQRQCSSLFGRLKADNAKFVSYNDRAPPPFVCLMSSHMAKSPRPSFSVFAYYKNRSQERPQNKARRVKV